LFTFLTTNAAFSYMGLATLVQQLSTSTKAKVQAESYNNLCAQQPRIHVCVSIKKK